MNHEILDRVPPHDARAEKAVLGCVMLVCKYLDDVVPILGEDDFYVAANGTIYKHILAMHEAGEANGDDQPIDAPIDMPKLLSRLTASGELEVAGGEANLGEIMQGAGVPSNAAIHARVIVDASKLRRLRLAGEQLIRAAHAKDAAPEEIASKAADHLVEIGAAGHATDAIDVAGVFADAITKLYQPDRPLGTPTGLYDFDLLIGGLYPGQLVVLAARPGKGKTALALTIMKNVAASKRDSLLVSLEMEREELARRFLSSQSGVDGKRIRDRDLTDEDLAAINEAVNELPIPHFALTDQQGLTTADIRWHSKRSQRKGNLGLIVVDYLQLIIAADSRAPRHVQVGQMIGDLKRLAMELGVPVLCLAQLNRQVESASSRRPQLSHLRESGSIEQDADVVMFLCRDDDDKRGEAELIIAKNRSGPTGDIKLSWDASTTTFRDYAPSHEWDPSREF